jgi:hypothetical protein
VLAALLLPLQELLCWRSGVCLQHRWLLLLLLLPWRRWRRRLQHGWLLLLPCCRWERGARQHAWLRLLHQLLLLLPPRWG